MCPLCCKDCAVRPVLAPVAGELGAADPRIFSKGVMKQMLVQGGTLQACWTKLGSKHQQHQKPENQDSQLNRINPGCLVSPAVLLLLQVTGFWGESCPPPPQKSTGEQRALPVAPCELLHAQDVSVAHGTSGAVATPTWCTLGLLQAASAVADQHPTNAIKGSNCTRSALPVFAPKTYQTAQYSHRMIFQ